MEKTREREDSLFIMFIDLKKAYDSVPRSALWSSQTSPTNVTDSKHILQLAVAIKILCYLIFIDTISNEKFFECKFSLSSQNQHLRCSIYN